jgi:leucyl aminopeptidase
MNNLRLLIYFIDTSSVSEKYLIKINNNIIKVQINIYNLTNYILTKQINKIINIIKIYDNIAKYIIIFNINDNKINKILSKLNDVLYNFYPETKTTEVFVKVNDKYIFSELHNYYMNELSLYKNITMAPNKNPKTFLDYVVSRIPSTYSRNIIDINNQELFPLTKAVGLGSSYKSYFVHIFPQTKNNGKNIYLIGKSVTYDSGGLNIKTLGMDEMKIDMTGASIIISVLNLLVNNKIDNKYNIHILLPIVENMIGSTAIKPGMVIKTMSNKLVEIVNTDAEGRLCIVDAIDYVNLNLLKDNPDNNLIIDIATLTGNTNHITSGISSLCMSNDVGKKYLDNLNIIGDEIGEYIDYLKIREEYLDMLKSTVADVKNIDLSIKAGCVIAGTFLNFFVKKEVPWIHIDLGVSTFVNSKVVSYGVNLLFEFIKNMN